MSLANYRIYLHDKNFLWTAFMSLVFLLLSFIVNFYAGIYAVEKASNSVTDLVLNNIPVFDVDGIFVYGPLILWIFVGILILREPQKIPFVLKSIALFILIRSFFITLTHIGPFPDQITIQNFPNVVNKFSAGGDLFFSAHTGLPFLMALIFWDYIYLRILFISSAIFFGVIVLLAHLHYSIDVVSAFFITFAIYRIAEIFFKKDHRLFIHGIES